MGAHANKEASQWGLVPTRKLVNEGSYVVM